ncbi:MAG: hypothetical protein LBP92_15560 [Deltaproteobacteria bacterium]|jgi:ribosomal protein S17E|nr:hypothetical protein [Deltaproteobacteria bacterium]
MNDNKNYESLYDMLGLPRDCIDDFLSGMDKQEISNKFNKFNKSFLTCMNIFHESINHEQKNYTNEEIDKLAKFFIIPYFHKILSDFNFNKEIAEKFNINNAESIYNKIVEYLSKISYSWGINNNCQPINDYINNYLKVK